MTIFQKKKTHFLDQHFLSKTIKRVFPTRRVVFPTRHFEDYTLETKGLWTCWRLLCTPDSSVWHPLWPQPFQRKWCWTVFVVESTPALQFCLIDLRAAVSNKAVLNGTMSLWHKYSDMQFMLKTGRWNNVQERRRRRLKRPNVSLKLATSSWRVGFNDSISV